jgi:hypothetical protein
VADTPVDLSLGVEAREVLGGAPDAVVDRAEMLRSSTVLTDEARSLGDEIGI